MISKRLIKYIQALHSRKFRQKYNKFICQGPKIVLEILQSNSLPVEYLCITEEFKAQHLQLVQNFEEQTIIVNEKELKSISTLKSPAGALIVCDQINNKEFIKKDDIWRIYLDRVQDPGNVGTIIRIADWFGIEELILGANCADIYNPKVVQSSMGGILRIKLIQKEFHELKEAFPQVLSYCAVMEGESIYSTKPKPGVIIIGNESKGIQDSILNASDYKINIPAKGGAESLNAAVACGIIVSHFLQ